MENKIVGHTLGPWVVINRRAKSAAQDCYAVQPLADNRRLLAEIPIQEWPDHQTMNCQDYGWPDAEARANAHLIAAAPDLLEALYRLLECHRLKISLDTNTGAVLQARAAIAKAKGQS